MNELIKDMHEAHVIQNMKLLLIVMILNTYKNLYSFQVNSKLKFSFFWTYTKYYNIRLQYLL